MTTIYKYKLSVTEEQTLLIPKGARILCVKLQNGEPHIWAIVNTGEELESRTFEIVGTGNTMKERSMFSRVYIDTFQSPNLLNWFVGHVFEIIKP